MIPNYVISLIPRLILDYDDAAGIDATQSAADVAVFDVPFNCSVQSAFLLVTATCAGADATPVVKYDKRPTAGSDTGRGDGDIAHFVLGTTAGGSALYDADGLRTSLEPGDQVVVQLVTAAAGVGAAGSFVPVLNVEYSPEMWANISAGVETA